MAHDHGPADEENMAHHDSDGDLGELAVVVPAGVRPGETKLAVRLGGDRQLLVKVPQVASVGDRLILTRQERADGGSSWACTVRKQVARSGLPSAPLQEGTPTPEESMNALEGTAKEQRITILVPAGIRTGNAKLSFRASGEKVIIPTPPGARPGDKLVLSRALADQRGQVARDDKATWRCTLVRDRPIREEAEAQHQKLERVASMQLPLSGVPSMEDACTQLFNAARAAGCVVSPKLRRGAVPPLNIPGLLAAAPVEKDEVLCQVPVRFHISPSSVKRCASAFCQGVAGLKEIPASRHMEVAQAAFVAEVLRSAAANETTAPKGSAAPTVTDASGMQVAEAEVVDSEVWEVWKRYAHVLLREDFTGHPYLQAARDPTKLTEAFGPSAEADFLVSMAEDLSNLHQVVDTQIASADKFGGRDIQLDLFVQAKLSLLSRVFQTNVDSALVPVADLFNHAPDHVPGVLWNWCEEQQAMVLTAARAHRAGEELFISYGPRSNQLLYRTYGFSVAPCHEPSWSYIVQPHSVRSIYDMYLPDGERGALLVLDAKLMDESFCKVLHTIQKGGHDVAECVRLMVARCMWSYEESLAMQPALQALQRVRKMDLGSHAWWSGLSEVDQHLVSSDVMRVKMCEYLCLMTYFEAVEFYEGRLREEECMREGGIMRDLLSTALRLLKEQGRFVLRHVQEACTTIEQ